METRFIDFPGSRTFTAPLSVLYVVSLKAGKSLINTLPIFLYEEPLCLISNFSIFAGPRPLFIRFIAKLNERPFTEWADVEITLKEGQTEIS